MLADRRRPGKADAPQLAAERQPRRIVVRRRQRLVEPEHPGERPRADHRRRKPRPLLVGPGDDLERRLGLVADIVEAAHDLQRRHHPIGAVEPAPGRLRVEMAPGHHRRQVRVLSRPPREDIADAVDRDRAPGFLAPADEEPPRLGVEIARREPAHAALLGRPDPRELHQARPQPLAIDLKIAHPKSPQSGPACGARTKPATRLLLPAIVAQLLPREPSEHHALAKVPKPLQGLIDSRLVRSIRADRLFVLRIRHFIAIARRQRGFASKPRHRGYHKSPRHPQPSERAIAGAGSPSYTWRRVHGRTRLPSAPLLPQTTWYSESQLRAKATAQPAM